MKTQSTKFVSGALLDWSVRAIQIQDLEACKHLHYVDTVGTSRWEEYVYESPKALRQENLLGATAPFKYDILCRRSGSRVLMLSEGRDIVDHLIRDSLDAVFSPGLRKVSIAVHELVNAMTIKPTLYVLSFVHARVPAFGASLRSVSYYGDDLAEAALFRDQMKFLVFFTCGLRQATGGPEVIRLGGDGAVSFQLTMPYEARVLEVEEVLRFLRKEKYLLSEIWLDETHT